MATVQIWYACNLRIAMDWQVGNVFRSGRSPIKASGHCSQSSFLNSFDLASRLWDTPLSCSNDILAQWPRFLGMCWSMLVGNMVYHTFLDLFGTLLSVGAFSSTLSVAHSCNWTYCTTECTILHDCSPNAFNIFNELNEHVHTFVLACSLLLSFVISCSFIHIHSLIQILRHSTRAVI